jgi:hypothetical protein
MDEWDQAIEEQFGQELVNVINVQTIPNDINDNQETQLLIS